jgi:hypothetical protein
METTEPSVDEVGKGMKSGGKPKMQMGGMPPLAARAMASRQMQTPMPAKNSTPTARSIIQQKGSTPITRTPVSGAGTPITRTPGPMPSSPKTVIPRTIPTGPRGPRPATPMPSTPKPIRPMPARPMGGGPTAPVNMDKLNQVKALTAAASRPTPSRTMGPMKKGGGVETKKMHAKEASEIRGIKKELMTHESKAASKAHKGLKTGGIAGYKTGGLIQKFATGGVVNGAAGYKDGGFAKVACKDGGGFKAMKKGNC